MEEPGYIDQTTGDEDQTDGAEDTAGDEATNEGDGEGATDTGRSSQVDPAAPGADGGEASGTQTTTPSSVSPGPETGAIPKRTTAAPRPTPASSTGAPRPSTSTTSATTTPAGEFNAFVTLVEAELI